MTISGIAGSARISHLNAAGLKRAELHGKRLDKSSQARAVFEAPCLTSTGLNLADLYRRHVEGAFIPKADSIAMHMIVQFPKSLVDGENADLMLRCARAFGERVFGDQAIFADRLDRDEKGRHVVDLFIAPKYVKLTKRTEKVAVAMTRDLTALARKHKRPTVPSGMGRALQDEFFVFLRDHMALEGVKRGEKKPFAGSDWKAAEELALEELKAKSEELQRRIKSANDDIAVQRDELKKVRAAVARDQEDLERKREALAEDQRALDARLASEADQHRALLLDLDERNRVLDDRAKALADRDAKQADRQQDLDAEAAWWAKRDAKMKERKIRLDSREQELDGRDFSQSELQHQLDSKAAEVDAQQQTLAQQGANYAQREATIVQRELRVEAFKSGVEAFAKGELVAALLDNGVKKLRYCNAAAKQKYAEVLQPAFDLVWTFVKTICDRAAHIENEAQRTARRLLSEVISSASAFSQEWSEAAGIRRQAMEVTPEYSALAKLAEVDAVQKAVGAAPIDDGISLDVLDAMAVRGRGRTSR